jgi:lipopolysaccharide transport system permease protein
MFAVASICYEFINFLISFVILFCVMYVTGAEFHLMIFASVIPLALLVVMVTGIGLILAVLNTYFSDIQHMYSIFTLLLLYASALFYPMEIVPVTVQKIFTLNPIYSAVVSFRECVVYGTIPNMYTLAYLGVFGVVTLAIGIILFSMYSKKLVLEL